MSVNIVLIDYKGREYPWWDSTNFDAELALKYIIDPDTEARVFNVETNGKVFEVDLFTKEIRINPYKNLLMPY